MRNRLLMPALVFVAAAGCNGPLDVTPKGTIPTATAIIDAPSAHSALAGAYNGLQGTSSYGADVPALSDLSSDNAENSGSFTSYLEADHNQLTAANSAVYAIWRQSYDNVNRSNEIIDKVPTLTNVPADQKTEIVGEAYFLRALNYHNLLKFYGDVPLVLHATTSLTEAANVTRAPAAQVYDQILKDLDSAAVGISSDATTTASVGAVLALRARVLFYKGDYTGAEAAALAVEDLGYDLAGNYSDLFSITGNSTPEDIFKVVATQLQQSFLSYYYFAKSRGGVYELRPTRDLMHAYDPNYVPSASISTYHPTDLRGQWDISIAGSRVYGSKYRSIAGTEFFPVLRLGEIILIRAEALARNNQLPEAVAELQRIQARANAPLFVLGTHTQQEVIDAIVAERRKELAFEGDRWHDLNRLGITASVMGIDPNQALYPIPQAEIDVTPHLTQNPGY